MVRYLVHGLNSKLKARYSDPHCTVGIRLTAIQLPEPPGYRTSTCSVTEWSSEHNNHNHAT